MHTSRLLTTAIFIAALTLSTLSFGSTASAATITAASCSQANVQTAINSAAVGDTVQVPAGSCSWSSFTIAKAITLKGAGVGQTNITVSGNTITKQAAGITRISGFTFTKSGGGNESRGFYITGSWKSAEPIIIENNKFTISGSGLFRVEVAGGVIFSHNDFSGDWDDSFLQMKDDGDSGNSWKTADTMGMRDTTGKNNLYVEDNTFYGGTNQGTDCDDSTRCVYRHNTFTYSSFNSHGRDTSPIGVRHWEVYDNTWVYPGGTSQIANQNWLIWIRGATGVIFNNQLVDIAGSYWGNKPEIILSIRGAEDVRPQGACSSVSYPVPAQLGQNYNGTSYFTDPIYIWGNTGTQVISDGWNWGNPCGFTWSTFFQWGRDGIKTGAAKPGYTPYTYPHPLVSGGTTPPPSDTTPPTVSLTAPASGATVSGSAVTISASASDDVGVTSVGFRVDGATVSTDTTAPYSISWDTTSATNGSHTITAVASDAAGNTTTSSGIVVTVSNTTSATAPTISTQPTSQTVIAGQTATFSVAANGTSPLTYQWRKNGSSISGATNASYTTPATAIADSGSLYSVIVSNSAGSVTSQSVALTVQSTQQGNAQTLFGNTTPASIGADNTPWELGTIFSVTTTGTITGIRIYAAQGESGSHTARIRNGSKVIGGPYTFTATGPGWVTYTLPTPVSVTTGNTYTVSVSTGADAARAYSYTSGALTSAGSNGANLTYPANAGVYSATVGARPTTSWGGANYFRDIIFSPQSVTQPQPTVTLTAVPSTLGTGDSSAITWSSTNATACTGTSFATNNLTAGSVTVTPDNTTTYSISCTGAGGTATQSVTVTVGSLSALTTIDFPSASFSWTSNGSTCTASGGWSGTQTTSGSQTIAVPLTATTYILTCQSPSGPVQRSLTVSTSKTTTLSSKFTTNQSITTTAALNVRSTPSTSGTILGTQASGASGTIVGGPVSEGGYWWWEIDYASGVDGWSVENYLQ